MRKPYKIHAFRFLAVIGVYLLLAFIMTTTADPWRVLRMPWALESLDEYRDFGDAHRTGKAGLAMDPEGWDIAYVGSSRFETGLTTDYAGFGTQRVVNLGMAGGLIDENIAMGHFVIRQNPRLKTILLGIDSGDLTSRMNLSGQTDFDRSPLSNGQSDVERTLGYMVGVSALSESFVVFSKRAKDIKSKYTLTGQKFKYAPTGQMAGSLANAPSIRPFVTKRSDFFRSFARAHDTPEQSPLNKEKLGKLGKFLEEARVAGISVIMVITPRHALMQIHPKDDAPEEAAWERERCELVRLCEKINAMSAVGPEIRFLDFCTFSELNTQPLPKSSDGIFHTWPDLEHFTGELGLKLLERSFSEDADNTPDWGVDVLETGIETHLANLREGHKRYCRDNPADVAWFRSVIFPEQGD
jgi:hypothetical protein